MSSDLKLSVVTINFNNLPGLKRTMSSVFSQTYPHIEYIIIDGGSTDGSKEYIEQHAGNLTYWVSEKDKGIYQAQNKGVRKSTGDFILILNSGDILAASTVVEEAMLQIQPGSLIIGCDQFADNGKRKRLKTCPETVSAGFFLTRTIYHSSVLIAKEVYEKYGLYNEERKIVADWEFLLLTAGIYQCRYQHVPTILSVFDEQGISSKNEYRKLQAEERNAVHQKLLPGSIYDEISTLQLYLETKSINFQTFRKQQLLLRNRYNQLKFAIRTKSRFKSFLLLVGSATSFRLKFLAFKQWWSNR